MKKNLRIKSDEACLVLIDYQEKLMPVMDNEDFLTDRTVRMVKGANEFELPIILTQQYTRGLGETVEPISAELGNLPYIDKKTFSAYKNEEFKKKLAEAKRKTVLLCGIETHICVMQTALDMMEAGYNVVLIEDACSSRSDRDSQVAVMRLAEAGVVVTTVESALMEMAGGADSDHFRAISKIIK